jgi:hypothetical protein
MTGPEHYREAEQPITNALEASDGEVATCWSFDEAIRTAQVHATLALAAATGVNSANKDERGEWQRVAGAEI